MFCVQCLLFLYASCNHNIYLFISKSIYQSFYLSNTLTSLIQTLLDQVEQYSSSSTTNNNKHDDSPHLTGSTIDYNPSIMNTTTTTTNSTTANNIPLTIIDIINFKKRNGQPLRFGVSRPGNNGSHTMAHYTAILFYMLYYTIPPSLLESMKHGVKW